MKGIQYLICLFYRLCPLDMQIPSSVMNNDVPSLILNTWTIACGHMSRSSLCQFHHILFQHVSDQNHEAFQSYGQVHEPKSKQNNSKIAIIMVVSLQDC